MSASGPSKCLTTVLELVVRATSGPHEAPAGPYPAGSASGAREAPPHLVRECISWGLVSFQTDGLWGLWNFLCFRLAPRGICGENIIGGTR